MKHFSFLLFAVLSVLLTACKSDTMSPVTEKIQGPLGEYFEIVSKDYKAIDGKVSIEIKPIKAGFPAPWKEGMEVGRDDGYFEPCFTIDFQDADGNIISKDRTDIVFDREDLKAIAALGVDETASVSFDCKGEASQFKMGSTFECHGEVEVTVNLEGGIGKYPIMMTMHIASDGNVTGAYYYKSKGPGNYLYIKGEKSDDRITLNEFTKDGQQTGTYEGTYQNGIYKGHFNTKSGHYTFVLKPTQMDAIDFSDIDFDLFQAEYLTYDEEDTDDYSEASGSEDWDSLLDSYEKYVDKYISYVKKAAKGDMSALSEYPDLLEKAQEFSSKMENAQGEMSSSQWSRYMKITNKLARAGQNLR